MFALGTNTMNTSIRHYVKEKLERINLLNEQYIVLVVINFRNTKP